MRAVPDRPPGRAKAGASDRGARAVEAAGVAMTAAFAAGGLLTQFVTVPRWRRLDPAAFRAHFARSGPATGAVLFPIEVASTVLLGRAAIEATKNGGPGRRAWTLATSGMVGTLILLPVYFVRANVALLDPAFPPEAVPAELAVWSRWNWLRTGLALGATAISCIAATMTTRRG